ncbi:MAG TPA: restriction endonuclease subunit S [Nitrospirota bacterium]|nr:restriction endonuclease subunit S [Nitrospirota bacterium]
MAVWSEVNFHNLTEDLRLDSEYYQPEHLKLDHLLKEMGAPLWGTLDGNFIVGPFGSAFLVENYVEKSSYRYIRGRDVKPFFLLDDENCYMPEDHFDRLRKYELQQGDLLVSVVGTLGNVSVVTKDAGKAVFSCKSTAFRPKNVDSFYLCAYLNSSIGQSYLQRMVRGHVQTGLNLGDLKEIPIFIPNESAERKIGDIVRRAYSKRSESKGLYAQAEALLLSDLDLNDLDVSPTLFYERRFSEAERSARLDAEFFQPAYQKIVDICCAYKGGAETLETLLVSMTNGVECRTFVDEGVAYIRVGDMGKLRIRYFNAVRISTEDASRLYFKVNLQEGDVLTARSGSIGQACVVTKNDLESVLSSHLMRLRARKNCPVLSDYLALFLATLPGIQQVMKNGNGGIVPEISQPFMKRIVVPILAKQTQQRLSDLIRESHQAEDESRDLLEEAKRMVEKAILGDNR